jgi:Fe-Mn family superoxide dismutase
MLYKISDMNAIEEKVERINKQLNEIEVKKNKELFLTEMKKIGIEKLPYSYTALKQFIDAETMSYHYNKHYKGYVEKLNNALSKGKYGDLELEDIIKNISKYNKTIRNNAGGAFNHALFWKMLTPTTQKPSGEVYKKIISQFKTFANFKTKFEEVAKDGFGSGWVWLVLSSNKTLKIVTTPNQDNPLMNIIKNGGYPLLGLDLWEHAYYLKYRNKRDEYIKNFWKCVNWEFVNQLYSMKTNKTLTESVRINQLIMEQKSEKCSPSITEEIRKVFNSNPTVKYIYKQSIDRILKEVFPDNYYGVNEYGEGEMSGIYDLETQGRSVINKLNTNYSCFCVLLNDINTVLKKKGVDPIYLIGKSKTEQNSATDKFVSIIDKFKERIFNTESSTFLNLMSILNQTNKWGDAREDLVVKKLKPMFGEKNVTKVGQLGSREDMIGGIDCEINIDGVKNTAQIKPFTYTKNINGLVSIFGSGNVKKYNTDLLIFANSKGQILVFKNSDSKIVNGTFVFPENNLIYTVD